MENQITFEEIFTLEHLLNAHLLCRKCKQHKKEIIKFEQNLGMNLVKLHQELISGKYVVGKYRSFYIREPKLRFVESLSYRHRIVQRCLCEYCLKPVIDKTLIYDNCACRVGKGSHFALKRLKKHVQDYVKKNGNEGYALVCDIKKYFPSLDHDLILEKLKKYNFDDKTYGLLTQYIRSADKGDHKGIPIGNQISQWIALLYLDSLDKNIKHVLKIEFYVRYMDDFIIILKSKQKLAQIKLKILELLKKEKLSLKLKNDFVYLSNGIPFLGFVTVTFKNNKVKRRVKRETIERIRLNLNILTYLTGAGLLEFEFLRIRKDCYHAHMLFNDFFSRKVS